MFNTVQDFSVFSPDEGEVEGFFDLTQWSVQHYGLQRCRNCPAAAVIACLEYSECHSNLHEQCFSQEQAKWQMQPTEVNSTNRKSNEIQYFTWFDSWVICAKRSAESYDLLAAKWYQKKLTDYCIKLLFCAPLNQRPISLPPESAGQHSSSLAVQQRGMEQPRLTLPIPAQASVSHGPHPASVYCFQSRQFPCHAWRIASSSVYFSAAAYSWLPGLASWLLSLFSHRIESGCVRLHNHCMCVRVWRRRRWRVCVWGGLFW